MQVLIGIYEDELTIGEEFEMDGKKSRSLKGNMVKVVIKREIVKVISD